ncbi:MAG: hypothetical protein HOP08_16915 [Cyclobacteriaceae bacterium]|nr:hypothetical protein [Cyclobacteriaceae bacterium]
MSIELIFVALFIIYFFLIWRAGKTFPILELFFFIYFIQYIFSTYLIYNNYPQLESWMPVKEDEYFGNAIPAMAFLFGGAFLFGKNINLRPLLMNIETDKAVKLGYFLLAISYTMSILPLIGISLFNSILSFTSFLKYVGAFCFLFSTNRFRFLIITLVYIQSLTEAFAGAIFVDFFIWTTYLFFILILKFRFPFWLRASFIVLAAPVLILIQGSKSEYRKATWTGKKETGLNTFSELAAAKNLKNADAPFIESDGVVKTVGRLTQGWHFGLTMRWVPRREPWSDGKEMVSDIASSLLPRVLFSDKKLAATQDKFRKYTGYKLRNSTSMTIGVLGDFYVNFGPAGSLIMLFIYGVVIAKFLQFFITRFVIPDPINIIWIPFMFNYLVRANNDFYTGLNCIVKGFLIFVLINWLKKRLWKESQA